MCRSVPAGCLWTGGWGGCAPVGSGCALVGRFKRQREGGNVEHSISQLHRSSWCGARVQVYQHTYLLEEGEPSFMARNSLEELTFLN